MSEINWKRVTECLPETAAPGIYRPLLVRYQYLEGSGFDVGILKADGWYTQGLQKVSESGRFAVVTHWTDFDPPADADKTAIIANPGTGEAHVAESHELKDFKP